MAGSSKQPLTENGVVVGTGSNKFEQKNPIVQWAIRRFDQTVVNLAARTDPSHILEVGCGEGHVTALLLAATRASILGMDISDRVLALARENVRSDRAQFRKQSILDLDPERDRAPLVVCCEVLEHLDDPEVGLRRLARAAQPHALLSVPREPLFRTLNLLRGAHLASLGNSPGHRQHWSTRSFLDFVRRELDILEVRTPLPWTVVLAKSRRAAGD